MVHGRCLCGDVAFEAAGDFGVMAHCHCSMCRKAHGAAFATYVSTDEDGFRWMRGIDEAGEYESSPGARRAFCSRCGSVLPGGDSGRVFLPAGCLDEDPGVRPVSHIFVGSKASWYEIADPLERFDAYPPGIGGAVDRPEVPRSGGGVVRGSCLCGGVAYELAGPAGHFANCHCRRCRRARSAAHASNLFGSARHFRFVRGEELGRSYRVPEAKRFTQTFCRICSSPMPRVSTDGERVMIPAGSIDGDPGARPQAHIFVGSKAPWFEITDALPQFDEYPPGVG